VNERWVFLGFGAVLGLALGMVATGAALGADAADMGSLAEWATAAFVAVGFGALVALLLADRDRDRRPLAVETHVEGDDLLVVLRNRGRSPEQFVRLGIEADGAPAPADPYATGDTEGLAERGTFVQPRTSFVWRLTAAQLRVLRAADPHLRDSEAEPGRPRGARLFVEDGVGNRYDAPEPIELPPLDR
jgi:hypothetical protein